MQIWNLKCCTKKTKTTFHLLSKEVGLEFLKSTSFHYCLLQLLPFHQGFYPEVGFLQFTVYGYEHLLRLRVLSHLSSVIMAHRLSRRDKEKWVAEPPRQTRRPPIQIPAMDNKALIEENKLTLIGRVTNPAIQKTRPLVDFFLCSIKKK